MLVLSARCLEFWLVDVSACACIAVAFFYSRKMIDELFDLCVLIFVFPLDLCLSLCPKGFIKTSPVEGPNRWKDPQRFPIETSALQQGWPHFVDPKNLIAYLIQYCAKYYYTSYNKSVSQGYIRQHLVNPSTFMPRNQEILSWSLIFVRLHLRSPGQFHHIRCSRCTIIQCRLHMTRTKIIHLSSLSILFSTIHL